MIHARHPSVVSKRKPFKPCIFEFLERRRLLTTFHGGDSFSFFDELGHYERVSFFGNITAEVIGATGAGNSLINLPAATFGPSPSPNPLNSLFAIYVSQSDFTGGITLAQVPNSNFNATPLTNLASTPFAGSIGSITAQNAQTGLLNPVASPAGTGAAILGALTLPTAAINPAQPVLTLPVNQAFGVLPPSITTLHAGLTVAPGQNLGNCYIGGTVMGEVKIGGAVNDFYAGWLITGDANGETTNNVTDPQNFSVGGNIRNLYTMGTIGSDSDAGLTAPTYVSGFDMHVSGTIGTVHSLNGSIVGAVNSDNLTGVPNDGDNQTETEIINNTANHDFFANDELGGSAALQNDTLATAQFISDGFNTTLNTDNSVVVDGSIQDDMTNVDKVDYYAVPLLAGQTITVQVTPVAETDTFTPSGAATGSVFKLTATLPNLSTQTVSFTVGADTSATAITAGLIAAWNANSATLALARATGTSSLMLTALDANTPLDITGSVIGLGALDKSTSGGGNAAAVQAGVFDPDGREIASDYNRPVPTATAGQPFQFTTDRPGVYRFAVAPTGDSQFTGSSGIVGDLDYTLTISNVGHMAIGSVVASANVCDNTATGFGGGGSVAGFGTLSDDLGAIVAGGSFVSASGNTVSVENGNVRALVAGTIGTAAGGTDPEITVPNGNVGLVESTGGDMYFNNPATFGNQTAPAIGGDYELVSSAGNFLGQLIANGNIGTVRVQSIIPDIRGNSIFSVNANHVAASGSINLIDDAGDLGSGALGGPSIRVGPDGTLKYLHVGGTVFRNSTFGQTGGQTITYDPGTSAQFVESTGAIVTLTPVVTTAVAAPALTVTTYGLEDGGSAIVSVVSTGGLTVQTTGNVANQAVGIGSVTLQGQGNSIIAGTSNLSQTFNGLSTLEILSPPSLSTAVSPVNALFTGTSQLSVFDLTGGNFDTIANNTPGGEIVNVNAASIGTLTGNGPIGFNLAHNTAAALLPNDVVLNTFPFNGQRTGVVVSGGIVNVSMAAVGDLSVGGNVGTISGTIAAPVVVGGQLNNVILGSGGIRPSGSGNLSNAGLYVSGIIGNVVGNNADIRGTVISNTGIQSIHLENGSIINAVIDVATNFATTANISQGGANSNPTNGTLTHPILDLGSIVTNGNGGIIGSLIDSANLGVIAVRNGFGILNTIQTTISNGFLGSVYADGYGIRGYTWVGGFNVGSITANGDGRLESTAVFSDQVRFSERVQFDPLFGFTPNAATDLDSLLGATVTTPVIPGVTDTGVIEDSSFVGSRQLKSVKAWSIRSATPDEGGTTTFNFSNAIGSVVTTGPVDGMSIITGKLGTLSTAGDLKHTSLTIAGRINNLTVHANITDSSSIIAHGRNGNIGKLTVFGNVEGLIEADGGRIGTVTIHGSLFGKIKTKFIQNLILFQNLGNGSLEITGSAGTIRFVQDLGPTGNTLQVDGKVNVLRVGSNLTGNVVILAGLNKLQVAGAIVTGSKVTVSKVLNLLQVGSDFQAGAIVQAHAVKKVKVRGVNAGSIVIV